MVALESLPMHVSALPHFWLQCLGSAPGIEFVNLLCSSCTYFKEYVGTILSQERDFLEDENLFELIKICFPKVGFGFRKLFH